MRSLQRTHQQGDRNWIGRGSGTRLARSRELVVLALWHCAAAADDSHHESEQHHRGSRPHLDSSFVLIRTPLQTHRTPPGVRSCGGVERIKRYGLALSVSVSSLRFSVTCRKLSSISSIFSEFTST